MWRSSRAAAAIAFVAALGGCAGSEDAPPEGMISAAAAEESDPVGVLRNGVRALGETPDAAAPADLERRVRALLALLARDEFDRWPDERARLRVDLVYVMNPPPGESRSEALERAEASIARMRDGGASESRSANR